MAALFGKYDPSFALQKPRAPVHDFSLGRGRAGDERGEEAEGDVLLLRQEMPFKKEKGFMV